MNDDDDDMGAMWADHKAASQAKRAKNRDSSAEILRKAGVRFTSANNGAHIIIEDETFRVNFWPGTGLFNVIRPQSRTGRGVFKLISTLTQLGYTHTQEK